MKKKNIKRILIETQNKSKTQIPQKKKNTQKKKIKNPIEKNSIKYRNIKIIKKKEKNKH
ncbi:hypothetical protein ACN2CX_10500 [Aliarcobacter butzleri]|uniref:hypothetical protein n=1 Tax=Aliarcobacter butzleri TaxID=28197 RepID=UPI003AFAF78F